MKEEDFSKVIKQFQETSTSADIVWTIVICESCSRQWRTPLNMPGINPHFGFGGLCSTCLDKSGKTSKDYE